MVNTNCHVYWKRWYHFCEKIKIILWVFETNLIDWRTWHAHIPSCQKACDYCKSIQIYLFIFRRVSSSSHNGHNLSLRWRTRISSVRKITRTHTNECKYYSRTIILWLTFCISFLFVNFFLNFSISQFFYFCFFVLRLNCQYLPKCKLKQECIPVVCVPPARWLYPVVSNAGGGSLPTSQMQTPWIQTPLWTGWQTLVKTLPFPRLRLRAVICSLLHCI